MEMDLNRPPETFFRIKKNSPIPQYLLSAAADASYDFMDATYFIYSKILQRMVFAVHIDGQQNLGEINESVWLYEYYIDDDWFVFTTISTFEALYRIDNGNPELLIECKRFEQHNLRGEKRKKAIVFEYDATNEDDANFAKQIKEASKGTNSLKNMLQNFLKIRRVENTLKSKK